MDKNIWTDNASEAARHAADQHIKEGLRVVYIPVVLLLVVLPLIAWTLPSGIRKALANITPPHVSYTLLVTCTTAFVVSGLIPDLMRILMYTGFQFGQRQMLPPVLPSSCELARQIEERNDVWPCAKEELHAAWRNGGLSAEVLWQNMLWWMLLQVVWVIGFGFAAAWMSEAMSSKEGKACTLQSCPCQNPEQVDRKGSTVIGAKSKAQIDFPRPSA
ncbi:hypothetical protein TI39_contig4100g00026 [Zymoseptoria brevis]|uniref:Uncharacterized protein n=1 Tax=Zymoseptoria brevis TaxID=1047168 RepID=A0A0F4GDY6_9PEZI|nr:hypothetical protein TI39_contig4100g00026 [Zymoseptoria brevis]